MSLDVVDSMLRLGSFDFRGRAICQSPLVNAANYMEAYDPK